MQVRLLGQVKQQVVVSGKQTEHLELSPVQLEDDAAGRLAADGDVKKDLGASHFVMFTEIWQVGP